MRDEPPLNEVALAAGAGLLWPGVARACGGFFASEVAVDPDQKIVVAFRDGVETCVFRPHFCGAARDFGVILPIPSRLRQAPALADNALFDQLDVLTAPEVEEVRESSGGDADLARMARQRAPDQ